MSVMRPNASDAGFARTAPSHPWTESNETLGGSMIRKSTLVALAVALAAVALVAASPALAITGGSPDTVHKSVGVVRFTTAEGRFRCSGTLIAPSVVLTAGHCTEGPATNVFVSFDDALQPDPLQPGISPAERAAREAHYITGTAHPDPGWTGKLSISKQHDQGVVVLSAPAASKWPGITPAPLPPVGFLDRNQGELKNATFTLVGYGVDIGDKKAQVVVQERRSTTSFLKNVQNEVVVFQINGNDSKAGGGSCFGDSGGPVFLDGFVLGDASYVNSFTCNATGSYQRDDTAYSRAFLDSFLGS
jgi:Trypsin